MADLSDFLGHVLEEITRARVLADLEAVRTAKSYASDPDGLLQYFAVPRLRLPNVEITAPMIVTLVPAGAAARTDPDILSRTVSEEIWKFLTGRKIRITIDTIVSVIKADPSLSKGYLEASSADTLSAGIGNQFKVQATKTQSAEAGHAAVVAVVREQLTRILQSLPHAPVGIGIDATTSTVREFASPAGEGAKVVYVKMSISEEALEIEFEPPPEAVPGEPAAAPKIRRLSPE